MGASPTGVEWRAVSIKRYFLPGGNNNVALRSILLLD